MRRYVVSDTSTSSRVAGSRGPQGHASSRSARVCQSTAATGRTWALGLATSCSLCVQTSYQLLPHPAQAAHTPEVTSPPASFARTAGATRLAGLACPGLRAPDTVPRLLLLKRLGTTPCTPRAGTMKGSRQTPMASRLTLRPAQARASVRRQALVTDRGLQSATRLSSIDRVKQCVLLAVLSPGVPRSRSRNQPPAPQFFHHCISVTAGNLAQGELCCARSSACVGGTAL